jgi:spermidine synthase
MSPWKVSPRILFVVYCLSGAASLSDEIVWFKYLNLTFGATSAATATLLAVFLGGLALGSAAGARLVPRFSRPSVLFAAAESGVAAFALATPSLFQAVDSAYVWGYRHIGSSTPTLLAVRFLLSVVALLLPTFLMGITFPALAQCVEDDESAGRRSAALYGINTAGAVVGVVACGFVAIPVIGLRATLLASACTSLTAALLSMTATASSVRSPPAAVRRSPGRIWVFAAFLTGAAAMADEMAWTRILVLRLGSSVYAFTLMLALFLTGLVAGSLAGAAVRPRNMRRSIAVAQILLAATVVIQIFAFPAYTAILIAIATRVFQAASFGSLFAAEAVTTAAYLLLPTFLMGLTFALILRAATLESDLPPAAVGRLYSVNTVGGIGGALLAGFLTIPVWGSQPTLFGTAFLSGLVAISLLPRSVWVRAAVGVLLLVPWLPPRDSVILSASVFADVSPADVLYYDEGLTGTVSVKRYRGSPGAPRSLELNGVNVAGTTRDLLAVQKLQAHLPLSLAAHGDSVLHIGLGSGGTAYSASLHPVSRIRIVEISPEVADAAAQFFPDVNHGVLSDPRVQLTINDGRNFVLATLESFDVILSDSIHPRYAGNGSLYTRDYFRLCSRRLKPGGVISMWLPMYALLPENYRSIIRAFSEVFPNVSIWYAHSVPNSFTIVLATPEPRMRLSDFRDRVTTSGVARDLSEIGAADPAELLSYLMLAPADVRRWVADTPPHVDDRPAVEFESGRTIARVGTWARTFADLVSHRSRVEDFVDGLVPGDPLSQRVLDRFTAAGARLEEQRLAIEQRARREP